MNEVIKIVYLGSPDAAVAPLEFILKNSAQLSCEIVGVVSQPAKPQGRKQILVETPVARFAKAQNLALLTPTKASSEDFLAEFRKWEPDVAVTAAYGQILSDAFLAIPKRATINIHPSLLPKYRGATPVPAALLDGLKETGVTVLFTVKKLDAGNIIAQQSASIGEDETNQELTPRLFALGAEALPKVFASLRDRSFTGIVQNEAEVTFCKKIAKEDGLVDFDRPAGEIINRFRAYQPWPGSYSFFEGKRVAILKAKVCTEALTPKDRGEVLFCRPRKSLLIGCNGGAIEVFELQPAGGRPMEAPAFWNGVKQKDKAFFKDA